MQKIPQDDGAGKYSNNNKKFIFLGMVLLAFLIVMFFALKIFPQHQQITMLYAMPITFVWLGQQIPSRYKKRLEWITFPYKLIGEPEWAQLGKDYHRFNLSDVRRSDILRLLYLKKNAGVYADIDNIIDYNCLMRKISPKKGFYMFASLYEKMGMGNAFLFTDRVQDPQIIQTLQIIKQRLQNMKQDEILDTSKTGDLTGPYILRDLKIRTMEQSATCIRHEADTTWVWGFELMKE